MDTHVVILDTNHLLHTYYNSQHRLSFRVQGPSGQFEQKDTTIQNGIIKNWHRWTKMGYFPCVACFDRPCLPRKVFFQQQFGNMKIGSGEEYKGNREKMADDMYTASKDVLLAFKQAGIFTLAEDGYEADDLIKACIDRAMVKYPDMHIDVITNDADLLPLVSENVSVYLRSKKGTYAEDKAYEKTHYIEVTPRNYEEVVEGLSSYKGFLMPYNSILLHKLLRGDSSDQFGCKDISKLFPPTKWNAMVSKMIEGGVDFGSIFRYGYPTQRIMFRNEDREFEGTMEDALNSPDRDKLYTKVESPWELEEILNVLKEYTSLDDEQLNRIKKVYWGMCLNMPYVNKDPRFTRKQFKITGDKGLDIGTYKDADLRTVARSSFGINLGT